jgi:hypothetical protein
MKPPKRAAVRGTKAPPEQFNIRLSPKSAAAVNAYAQAHGLSRTKVLTDLIEFQLAGVEPDWLRQESESGNEIGCPSVGIGSTSGSLEDRLGRIVARTIDARMGDVRAGMVREFIQAVGWAVEGSDASTPEWALPFSGKLGDVIGAGLMGLLSSELEKPASRLSATNTNALAAYSAAHISAIYELLFSQSVSMRAPRGKPFEVANAQKEFVASVHQALDLGVSAATGMMVEPDWLVDQIARQKVMRQQRIDRDLAEVVMGVEVRAAIARLKASGRLARGYNNAEDFYETVWEEVSKAQSGSQTLAHYLSYGPTHYMVELAVNLPARGT